MRTYGSVGALGEQSPRATRFASTEFVSDPAYGAEDGPTEWSCGEVRSRGLGRNLDPSTLGETVIRRFQKATNGRFRSATNPPSISFRTRSLRQSFTGFGVKRNAGRPPKGGKAKAPIAG